MNLAALLSFIGLVSIQVTIGLVYSLAGKHGQYAFSQASALTIAECLKFFISTGLYIVESRNRHHDYQTLPTSSDELSVGTEDARRGESSILGVFVRANAEIPNNMKAGFAVLACLYAINNHLAFLLFLLADSGTISLIKSGSTFTTAVVLLLITGQNQAGRQWLAIVLQVLGLIITQTDFRSLYVSTSPTTETLYPYTTYGMLSLAAAITAISSVANEKLCKTTNNDRKISLNAQNMILYFTGAVINFSIYFSRSQFPAGFQEQAFFAGYDSFPAIMVVISNTVIGLAITAVYKYANAVIKCLAQAFATAVLLILGALLLSAPITVSTVPGSMLVFMGTYVYVTHVKSKSDLHNNTKATAKDDAEGVVTTAAPRGSTVGRVVGIFVLAYTVTLCMTFYFSWWALQLRPEHEAASHAG